MGSQKPIIGGYKPDLVAVILERSVAQQLALALAWALGTTGGGKTQGKVGVYPGVVKGTGGRKKMKDADVGMKKDADVGMKKAVGERKRVSEPKMAAGSKKSGGKKSGGKKSGGKK